MAMASPFLPAGAATAIQQAGAQRQQQNPLVPQQQAAPDPRVNGAQWDKFLEQLTQPGIMSALLGFGTRALQPVAPGQSDAGHIAQAGYGALVDQQKLQTSQAEAENRKTLTDLKKTQVEQQGEEVGIRKEQLQLEKEAQPVKLDKLKADIELAKAKARTAGQGEVGATENMVRSIGAWLLDANPGKYSSPSEAMLEATDIWRSTQNKSREETYQVWLQKLTEFASEKDLADPEYLEEQKQLAWDLAGTLQNRPDAPGAAPSPQAQAGVPVLYGAGGEAFPAAAHRGARGEQDGVMYQSDGKTWNPVPPAASGTIQR